MLIFLKDAAHLKLVPPNSVVCVTLLREEPEHILVLLAVGGFEIWPCVATIVECIRTRGHGSAPHHTGVDVYRILLFSESYHLTHVVSLHWHTH